MPHLQIDHSPGLPTGDLLAKLTEEFCRIDTIDPAAVKAYVRPATSFVPGYQAPEGFIHVTVCVLEGRNLEILNEISDRLYALGRECLQSILPHPISFTLEIREMNSPTYRKGSVG